MISQTFDQRGEFRALAECAVKGEGRIATFVVAAERDGRVETIYAYDTELLRDARKRSKVMWIKTSGDLQ
jgi:hypothetical protein